MGIEQAGGSEHEGVRLYPTAELLEPVALLEVAREMALAEKPFRDEIAEHRAHLPEHWWQGSDESRTRRRWRQDRCARLAVLATMESLATARRIVREDPKLAPLLYTRHKD